MFGCSGCTESAKNDDFKGATFAGHVVYDANNKSVNVPSTEIEYKVNMKGQGRIITHPKFKDKLIFVEGVVVDGRITINHLEEAE
jgi:hypothetical protein